MFLAVLREECGYRPGAGYPHPGICSESHARWFYVTWIGPRGRGLGPGRRRVYAAGTGVDDDPLLDLTHREGIDALRRAVQALPRRYREVVVLCDLEEVDYADAAVALGCPIGTVRSRLHRARALLVGKVETGSKSPAGGHAAQSGKVHIMNCQEFWNTMPESGTAHPHLQECPACARACERAQALPPVCARWQRAWRASKRRRGGGSAPAEGIPRAFGQSGSPPVPAVAPWFRR